MKKISRQTQAPLVSVTIAMLLACFLTATAMADEYNQDKCDQMDYHGGVIMLTEDDVPAQALLGDDGACVAFHIWALRIIQEHDAILCFAGDFWVPFTGGRCLTCKMAAELAIGY